MMYIQVTIDLRNYHKTELDLRLSNHSTVPQLIKIVWQVAKVTEPPRDGSWIRVRNKEKVYAGSYPLEELGIVSGDRIEIL